MGDLGGSLRAERVEERIQRGFVASWRGPHQCPGVVIDHDRQVAVAALVGDLVDPDPTQPGEAIHPHVDIGRDPRHDRPNRAPRDAHQLGDRALRGVHGQPGDLIVERAGVSGAVTRPRHLQHRRAVFRARDAWRVGLEPATQLTDVEIPPASPPFTTVIPRGPSSTPSAPLTGPLPGPHRHHDRVLVVVEADTLDHDARHTQQPLP